MKQDRDNGMSKQPRRSPEREASVTDLRQLSAAAAHEIRNPLNTMAIHCELLESRIGKARLGVDKEREAILRSIEVLTGEVQRIDKILDQFLTHAGPPEVDREPLDADAWLDEVVARSRAEAANKGVTVSLSHVALGRWNVDGVTLARAVQAVMENAILASSAGGQVEVEASSNGERALIRIIDHGEGIAPDLLPNVYHLGYSTRRGHAGLGLAIAKQVVKAQHGGDISIQSSPGQGTSVTMDVPLEDEI
jgi:signal transduction histidine kinase